MPRPRSSLPQIDGSLVGAGAGLGLLWALISIPVGLQWGVTPWSPLWERALAATLCLPLFAGFYGGAGLAWLGIAGSIFPLVLTIGIAAGALVGFILAYRLAR